MNIQLRQGDVFVQAISSVPLGAARKEVTGRLVLAFGEQTGHAHAILEIQDVEAYEKDGVTYLRVKEPVTLRHEEHTELTIPRGDYRVAIQREYTPEAIRNVQD